PGVAFCLRQRYTPPLATFFFPQKRKYARASGAENSASKTKAAHRSTRESNGSATQAARAAQ
ncbi:MAG TPA: hypothetical protein PLN02_03615, partial [Azonexus sp.]|nr:hypothetical protein [Azonexus sp.]